MHRFELARATSPSQARELLAEKAGSVFKAGGIDLVDHLKEHLLEPPGWSTSSASPASTRSLRPAMARSGSAPS
jgi:hypothetical protein